jgi:hypothetical protein
MLDFGLEPPSPPTFVVAVDEKEVQALVRRALAKYVLPALGTSLAGGGGGGTVGEKTGARDMFDKGGSFFMKSFVL